MPFIHGSTDMNGQLFTSYNQQLFVSLFNLINKYKQSQSLITQGFNYHVFVYLFFKYHLEQFPSVFKPVRYRIIYLSCRFTRSLKCFKLNIPALKCYIQDIKKKLDCIKECMCKMESCVENYLKQLNENIRCYIKRLDMTIKCTVERSGADSGCMIGLILSLEKCKEDLTSCIQSKICCLKNTELYTEELCKIISILDEICSSVDNDTSELCKLRNSTSNSESIKSEMDIFKSLVNKYIENITNIICQIDASLGLGCLHRLNFIYCGVSTIICFIQSKIKDFKLSVVLAIRSSVGMFCDIGPVSATIQCEIPSICTIEKELSQLICSLRNYICSIRNIMRCMENTKQIMESQLRNMGCIRTELDEMESSINMVNFFKCSNQSITQNTIDLTKRLSGIGNEISNNGLTKSNLHNQGLRNQEKEEYGGVWTILSHVSIMEPEKILLEIDKCHEKKEKIEEMLSSITCWCLFHFKFKDEPYYWNKLSDYKNEGRNLNESAGEIDENDGNHVCLCLVTKYHVYPRFVKSISLNFDIIKDLYSSCMRKFDRITKSRTLDWHRSKVALFFVEIIEEILNIIESRYLGHFFVTEHKVFRCFCRPPNDPYYPYFISTMIYISFLVERIFDNQNKTAWDSIQYLSALKAELEHAKCDKQAGGSSSCEVYSTSVCIKVSGYQVNHTLFYDKNKCNVDFKQIKDHCLYSKICCCKNPGCQAQSNCSCQRADGSCICCCCTADRTGTCAGCSCDGSVKSTWKFIVDHGVSKVNSEYCLSEKFPNFWCLYKWILCISKDTAGPCGCDNMDCIKSVKAKASHYYRIVTRVNSKMIPYIFNTGILCLMSKMEIDIKVFTKMVEITKHEKLVKTTRNIRIVDSTNEITNNRFEGVSNNHYSYNDAYRINTSRAHGSLKYIIIKIVLILIIVVMTIFIRVKIETDDYKIDNKSG